MPVWARHPCSHRWCRASWTNRTQDQNVLTKFAGSRPEDLALLRDRAEAGESQAAIDRRYPPDDAAGTHAYVGSGRRKRTVGLTMQIVRRLETRGA